MAIAPERLTVSFGRFFTKSEEDPYKSVVWERRDARITNYRDGKVAFEQLSVEVPNTWSLNATNILAQKYFRGTQGTSEREGSLKQVADRIVDTITEWGDKDGYFVDDEQRETFRAELKYLLIHQRAAFNSPVWFNIGVKGVPQQASACFILSVNDDMNSILNWYREEGIIFKGGSGAGVNLSKIRSSKELLQGGGTASGPVSFMRGADSSAGTIKSGGKTRRAAKMVILDVDHPDIEEFIWCKAIEERKARVLRDAGFDMDLDGKDSFSLQYQNANNSVRVKDEFMEAVAQDGEWELKAVTDGSVIKKVRARDLMREIAQAAWECADPGVQYDTTINKWHTAPKWGRISGSNPCSEYMHVDNSACNLASFNLLKYLNSDHSFDIEAFVHSVKVVFLAQEILVGNADYPTPEIGDNSRRFRELGIGYANLGALLMAQGLAYDSDEGRAWAGAITALMTGTAYATSTEMAARMGAFSEYENNKDAMQGVLTMHRRAVDYIDSSLVPSDLLGAARESWDRAIGGCSVFGVRNSQASVLAPTGTIGLLMDCDTTGVEPDLGLVKYKKLVGGGTMAFVNQTVPRALDALGYSQEEIAEIVNYIDKEKTIVGAPMLKIEHLPIFACSMGDNVIHYLGHIKMMAAVQPFISGAISKTVNMPEEASVEDIEQLYIDAWRMGLKAVAIYRDNCKVAQPLQSAKGSTTKLQQPSLLESTELERKVEELEKALQLQTVVVKQPIRERLPRKRRSSTFAFQVADCEGYVTVGEYDDGRPGEVFMKVSKQGSTLAGIMDAFSISVSLGLQHGVPLSTFVRKFTNMRFEPAGMTDDPDLRIASSLVDYIFRRLAVDYLPFDERQDLSILTSEERAQLTLFPTEEMVKDEKESVPPYGSSDAAHHSTRESLSDQRELISRSEQRDAPYCFECGNVMQRSGSCYVCSSCGTTSGCS